MKVQHIHTHRKQSHIKKRRRHIAMLNDESAKILDVMAPHSSHHQDEQSEQIEKKYEAIRIVDDETRLCCVDAMLMRC
eukprot:m.201828 g.201828  ORF g.201828 m.201828 type:complete len:78 (+) comp13718_c1_seq11:1275-1508(+)